MYSGSAYEICVQSHLGAGSAAAFRELDLRYTADGMTVLCSPVIDQAALHGLLIKIRDLGLVLISVRRVEGTAVASHK